MTSSFAAQQHGSRNPHQNPVRSHKGGYLRCPFNISASYAELAERRVREDLARGGRSTTAVTSKDGLSTSSAVSLDGVEGDFEGRPWSRAGVGAKKLTGKEKRMQQEQAELIYGRGSLAGADDSAGTPGAAASQENMFAVDARDQAALQQVVPRAVREKVKRRKFEELKKERRPLGQHHHLRTGPTAASGDDAVHTQASGHDSDEGELRRGSRREATAEWAQSSLAHRPSGSPVHSAEAAAAVPVSAAGAGSATPATAPVPQALRAAPAASSNRPKNRMQMLDDLRAAALTGKKRRR